MNFASMTGLTLWSLHDLERMVMSSRQADCWLYKTKADDTKPRYVSWAIFEIRWGETRNRHTKEFEPLTRGKMSMCRVCVYNVGQNNIASHQLYVEKSLQRWFGSA